MTQRLPEQKAWDVFKRHTDAAALRLWRVENITVQGMSDLIGINKNGASFFIEMKALEEWPKRESTKPLKNVFEPGQVPFMKEWIGYGGEAYVLIRVGTDEWFLLDPKCSIELVDMTKRQIMLFSWATGIEKIVEYLEDIE
jgi:penicillin-binding protein-related factor A (putative recombinase)